MGIFSDIQTKPKEKTGGIFSNVKTPPKASPYPALESAVTDNTFSGGFKTSTPQTTQFGTADVLGTIGQGFLKGYASAGAAFRGLPEQGRALVTNTPVRPGSQEIKPTSRLQQMLYGTKEPISLSSVGDEYGASKAGFNPALIGAFGSILDLSGAGGVKGLKGLTEIVKNAKTVGEVTPFLKNAGFADDIIEQYAPLLAKETDAKKVEKALLSAEKLQNTTKTTTPQSFDGFTDLSTKLLEKLKGRTTVSRQFIEDLSNSPDLKQAERDLIRRVLGESNELPIDRFTGNVGVPIGKSDKIFAGNTLESSRSLGNTGGTVEAKMAQIKAGERPPVTVSMNGDQFIVRDGNHTLEAYKRLGIKDIPVVDETGGKVFGTSQISVPDFANRVKSELLPLKVSGLGGPTGKQGQKIGGRYESITLPSELRGPVANYAEHIYESPIKTSAAGFHFEAEQVPNYFAHTRIEDLPDNATRRVIEAQSDLFQKGRLEGEKLNSKYTSGIHGADEFVQEALTDAQYAEYRTKLRAADKNAYLESVKPGLSKKIDTQVRAAEQKHIDSLSKLEPYRNTWHERVIREEVKQAAKDGKTKLQFPTGETALRIEGLGGERVFKFVSENKYGIREVGDFVDPATLKKGQTVYRDGFGDWLVTNVEDGGKFSAVSKKNLIDDMKFRFKDIPESDIISYIKNCL